MNFLANVGLIFAVIYVVLRIFSRDNSEASHEDAMKTAVATTVAILFVGTWIVVALGWLFLLAIVFQVLFR